MNPNCRKCYAAKRNSPEKGHILVKGDNSSMNGIYTKIFFYIHRKGFCKSQVSFLPFEIFIEIYSPRFLLMLFLCFSALISPYYNYSFLITITSQFPIYLPRNVGLGSGFFGCLNFWKQPSLSASKKMFSPKFFGNFTIKHLWQSPF